MGRGLDVWWWSETLFFLFLPKENNGFGGVFGAGFCRYPICLGPAKVWRVVECNTCICGTSCVALYSGLAVRLQPELLVTHNL